MEDSSEQKKGLNLRQGVNIVATVSDLSDRKSVDHRLRERNLWTHVTGSPRGGPALGCGSQDLFEKYAFALCVMCRALPMTDNLQCCLKHQYALPHLTCSPSPLESHPVMFL